MLTEALMSLASFLLSGIAALIPDVEFPWSTELSEFATFIGDRASALDSFLPIAEMTGVLGWVFLVYLPFVVTFLTFRFVYSHLPVVGT